MVINSELAKKHATDKDPWAMEWLEEQRGRRRRLSVEKWTPGQEIVFPRFDDWKIRAPAEVPAGHLRAWCRRPATGAR